MITASIVSHNHGAMVNQLVRQLAACPEVSQILLTRNLPEETSLVSLENLTVINNATPAGFGANHNAAFRRCTTPYFCVINPDVTFADNPFPALLVCLEAGRAVVAAPLVVAPDGCQEDSIRRFPTPLSLLIKAVTGADGCYPLTPGGPPVHPEWVAGMFMLVTSDAFRRLNGFDEGFFLYYEDVDLCARIWRSNQRVVACPSVYVVHDARRESRRNWRFMRWHLASMLRYFYKHLGRLPNVGKKIV